MFHLKKLISTSTYAVVLTLLALVSVDAKEFEKNILTGGASGTYVQFGKDIANLMQQCGQNLAVQESSGSLENLLGVRKRKSTQFGIVQSDLLRYLRTYSADDPEIAKAIRGVRIAFPLYNEEVHILAKRSIKNLQQLSGKRVAIGVADSGTFLTASLILDIAGVETGKTLTINPDESLAQLLAGEIDAFFYVAGAPTTLLTNADINPNYFHLLPITNPDLQSVYTEAELPAGTYPFQVDALDTIAVKAVLMTYEYRANGNTYNRQSCKAVSDVAHQILGQFSYLQKNGHPKWQQVDLTEIPPGWNISTCVNKGLSKNYQLSCSVNDNKPKKEGNQINSYYNKRICEVIGC